MVKFSVAAQGDPPIYINADAVVAVRQFTSSTHISVTTSDEKGGPFYYNVRETAEQVVEMLQGA
jgi:hypothetical protein